MMFDSTLAWHMAQPRSRTANTACSNFTAGVAVGVPSGGFRVLALPLNSVSEHPVVMETMAIVDIMSVMVAVLMSWCLLTSVIGCLSVSPTFS